MRTSALLTLLFFSLPLGTALASARGEWVFNRACSRCHTANPPKADGSTNGAVASSSDQRGKGPDLARTVRIRKPEALKAWIKAPYRVNPNTACDTRLAGPNETTDLLEFLYSQAKPLPLPDSQRRKALVEAAVKQGAISPSSLRRRNPDSRPNGK